VAAASWPPCGVAPCAHVAELAAATARRRTEPARDASGWIVERSGGAVRQRANHSDNLRRSAKAPSSAIAIDHRITLGSKSIKVAT
jgi:hypothetical protein